MRGFQAFNRRYWPALQRVPDPPRQLVPRLQALGPAPPNVWARAHRYLDSMMRGRRV